MKIKGLSEEQVQHMLRVNKLHIACNGLERQKNMQIVKAWVDKDNNVCVRLANGEWFHYYNNGTWG